MSGFYALFRRFLHAQHAQVAVTAAMLAVPMVGLAGGAIDYAMTSSRISQVQAALDAAVSAGVATARDGLSSGQGGTTAIANGSNAAQRYFRSNNSTGATASIAITQAGTKVNGTGTATGSMTTGFLGLLGVHSIQYTLNSTAAAALQPYMDVYLLVDISTSMLLPATPAGVAQMISGTGCALACHDNGWGVNWDSYAWARSQGIQLRYSVVNDGVQALLNYLSADAQLRTQVRVGLWSFDHQLRLNAAMTSSYGAVSMNFPAPALAVDDASAATPFDSYINDFVTQVGWAGDGSSAGSPQKLVILASDGVNDPTRAWASDPTLRPQVRAFNMSFCNTLKSRGVQVAIINTPYLPMNGDWGYDVTLGQPGNNGGATRVDDIPIVMNACAGNLYVSAGSVEAITAAFTNLFVKASRTTRYTQ